MPWRSAPSSDRARSGRSALGGLGGRAAEREGDRRRRDADGGWLLSGRKAWCSGAGICSHALITAHAEDGPRLFAVDLDSPGVSRSTAGGSAMALAGGDTRSVDLDVASSRRRSANRTVTSNGPASGTARRASRRSGTAARSGVARRAGGAAGAADRGHPLAHLGAVDVALGAARSARSTAAAAAIDADPDGPRWPRGSGGATYPRGGRGVGRGRWSTGSAERSARRRSR